MARNAQDSAVVLPGPSEPVTADDIVRAFVGAELPLRTFVVFDERTDPNGRIGRDSGYLSKASFADERIRQRSDPPDADDGGSVEVFGDAEDARERSEYVLRVLRRVPFVSPAGEFHYLAGPILLRLAGQLSPKQRQEYERVLRTMLPPTVRPPQPEIRVSRSGRSIAVRWAGDPSWYRLDADADATANGGIGERLRTDEPFSPDEEWTTLGNG
ncbi:MULTISPECIES: hypothetical protein [Actinomadura]|uniref:Uncharacterized protein n=1 Tax=Actinomadura yumaensis TaxID=111807 RepID=A0ABW2CVD5_9ACTN|nr:hypothetical protein [Actinomadura sp. J1-007]MWK34135.1 hypothetical protein [Actinomadura sp. J1-007]